MTSSRRTVVYAWLYAMCVSTVLHAGAYVAAQESPPQPRPDIKDVRYGPHERHLLDLYLAESEEPTPLVIMIHGGGFIGGDKEKIYGVRAYLDDGLSVASVQYRLAPEHPHPAAFHDAARAVQFLRHNAARYNLDGARFATIGASAGGGLSLWLALHDDLAEPDADDPIDRQSTRVSCAVGIGAQASYDPRFWVAHGMGAGLQEPALSLMYGLKPGTVFDQPFDDERLITIAEECAPITHVSPDDPPLLLLYDVPDKPINDETPLWAIVHHPRHGRLLQEKLEPMGVEHRIYFYKDFDDAGAETLAFLKHHLVK